jgi:ATP-dependent Lon protease
VKLVDLRKGDPNAAFFEEVTPDFVEHLLGPQRYRIEDAERHLRPGVATALASTPDGGQLMFVEASKMPGKGKVRLTGNMRNVMQESAATAVSYVRSKADKLQLSPEWLKDIDLHLHIPQHSVPKDGPSAGIAMFAAVASLILDCPLRADVAMTGEISLRGRVLPIEGLTQKLLVAHRAGIREVLIPERNKFELEEVPSNIVDKVAVHLIGSIEQVLPLVLEPPTERSGSIPSDSDHAAASS